MKHLFILLSFFFTTLLVQAQNHPTCDGSRYVSEVFTGVDTTRSILFGNNTTFGGNNQDLYMDIYQPVGDVATARPTIVLAFGGSFIFGDRGDMATLCHYYAQRGYVAVSIDYRLYDGPLFPLPTAADMTDVVIKAVGDMKAAVRFLRQDAANANNYKIDTNHIFVGGVSAGGIVAAHTAYLDATDSLGASEQAAVTSNGGYEGNSSNNVGLHNSSVQGVLNFSGALRSASYINANEAPLFSAHDDGDGVVPYGNGSASIGGFPIITVEGSQTMATRATSVGLANLLVTIPNSTGHVSYFNGNNVAQWSDSVGSAASQFLHDESICPIIVSVNTPLPQELLANFYPNPSASDVVIALDELPSAYDLVLYDNMGRVVRSINNIQEDRYLLERAQLPAGVYHAQLQFEDTNIVPIQASIIFQ
ncbi:MAG: alpha/beta hydrolase fold domain-containing protein [Aureispira sp.]